MNDKVRILDLQAIDAKKKVYKDLLDQTLEQEQSMQELTLQTREFYSRTTVDVSRRLQEELTNYQDRLYDVKMFLSERLAKYNRLDKTLSDFEVRRTMRKRTMIIWIFIERSGRSEDLDAKCSTTISQS